MLIAPRALNKEPIFVSQLVQNAMNSIALSTLEKMLNSFEFSDEDLQQLQQTVRQTDLQTGFRDAMLGERVTGMQVIRNPGQLGSEVPVRLPNTNEDLAFYLKYMGKWTAASREPFPKALDRVELISQEFEEELAGSGFARVRYQLTALLLPAMDSIFEATARGVAATQATETFIAVERFRKQQGRFPDSLDALVPEFLSEVPMDPFDGKPLRYVITDDAALIYSIGRNRIDDNGTLGDERLDEVFRLELKKTTGAEPTE
ncbi:MAG: hypothetical protein CMJ64_05830 [Planctomycetaceae bacterium]|nr:hypothetical protein [Planctomycetaceae bacterium]